MAKEKTCFIISSIGELGTKTRTESDQKLNHVFRQTLQKLGYTVIRADEVNNSGLISKDIIKHLKNDDLVLADVSDENPNVFYELAIRNAFRKPVIIFKNPEQNLPFDIQDKRAILIDMTNPDIWTASIELLKTYVKESEEQPEVASESILSEFFVTESLIQNNKFSNQVFSEIKLVHKKLETLKQESSKGENQPSSEIETMYTAGTHLFEQENFGGAMICFDEVIKINDSYEYTWYLKGVCHNNNSEHTEALDCFKKMYKINSEHPSSIFYIAITLGKLKQFKEGLEYAKIYLKFESDAPAHLLKALFLLETGDLVKALEHTNKAIELDDKNHTALTHKADILEKLGNKAESEKFRKKGKEMEEESEKNTE